MLGLSHVILAQAFTARSPVNEAQRGVIAICTTCRKRQAYYRYRGKAP